MALCWIESRRSVANRLTRSPIEPLKRNGKTRQLVSATKQSLRAPVFNIPLRYEALIKLAAKLSCEIPVIYTCRCRDNRCAYLRARNASHVPRSITLQRNDVCVERQSRILNKITLITESFENTARCCNYRKYTDVLGNIDVHLLDYLCAYLLDSYVNVYESIGTLVRILSQIYTMCIV